jgi:hypothetical protein
LIFDLTIEIVGAAALFMSDSIKQARDRQAQLPAMFRANRDSGCADNLAISFGRFHFALGSVGTRFRKKLVTISLGFTRPL